MVEIIPAIIAKDFNELKAKIKLVEPFVRTVQIDVMDGVFVSNLTWNNPIELETLETNLMLEAHLMVENPHRVLNEWLNSRVKRVILHWEAMEKIHNHELLPYRTQVGAGFPVSNLAEEAHRNNKEFGVALNLETPISVLDNFINDIDMVLLMSAKPGEGGQKLQEEVFPKISALRQKYPDVKIGVDDGINEQNVARLIKAGANFLAVGSAIFQNQDIEDSIKKLKVLLIENN
jgi:ribulose-phosphate 3-epimerase